MEKLFIIKIGGNLLDDSGRLSTFLEMFSAIAGNKILVHGGGRIATRIGARMGIKEKYEAGRRITDGDTLDLVTMVYGGLVNKQIVAKLQSLKCNAIGLTGADAGLIPAVKRPVGQVDYGFAGDIVPGGIRSATCTLLINQGLVPVFAPLTYEDSGTLLNTNADSIASALGIALSATFEVRLIFCFDKGGVLERPQDPDSVIHSLDPERYRQLKSRGVLNNGILPKLDAAFEALAKGVSEVVIGDTAQLMQHVQGNISGTLIHA
jgi:acetylglutamate kinase